MKFPIYLFTVQSRLQAYTCVQPMTKPSRYVQSQIPTKGLRKRKTRVIFLRFSAFSIPKLKAKYMLKERDEAEWVRIE